MLCGLKGRYHSKFSLISSLNLSFSFSMAFKSFLLVPF